ncbi:MAG: hypothetical protein ACK5OX_10730 [Desertimonas sp.]
MHGVTHHHPRRRHRIIIGLLTAVAGLAGAGAGTVTAASDSSTATPPGTGAPTPPDGLGDNPTFDALAQACFGGDLGSCDDLYWRTDVGSAYEEYGATCGGRVAERISGDCAVTLGADPATAPPPATDLAAPTLEPTGLGTDVTLDALAQECHAGAMFACDKLFVLGEEGTAYYEFGFSCAGRQTLDSSSFCHELVGFPGPGVDFETLPVPDDEEVLAGIASCTIGDMRSCDDLYRSLDAASPYLAFADTCAGRQPEGTGTLCVNAFPSWEQLVAVAPTVTTSTADTATSTPSTAGQPTDPTGLGSDATLNALAENCFDGDMSSCDNLFWRSPLGSTYESYGGTCGGRFATVESGTCAQRGAGATTVADATVPAATLEPGGLGANTELDPLAQDCYAGAMIACDKLFLLASDADVAYEEYGDTCAGRQPSDSGDFCHELAGFPGPSFDVSVLPTDDADLIVSASLCLIGDMQACDDIFRSAPDGSPFVDFADTCAGRQEVGTNQYCTVSFPEYELLYQTAADADPVVTTTTATTTSGDTSTGDTSTGGGIPAPTLEPTGLGSDLTLDTLAQYCHGGAMQACDDLFAQSPEASAYQAYGDTCAGRQPADTGAYCVVSFPG